MEVKRGRWDSSEEEDDEHEPQKVARKKKAKQQQEAPLSSAIAISSAESSSIQIEAIVDAHSPAKSPVGVDFVDQSFSASLAEPEKAPPVVAELLALPAPEVKDDESAAEEQPQKEVEHNSVVYGCRSVDEYQKINFIDQGTYGLVFRAKCRKTGQTYALKQVKIGREANKVGFPITALRETNILLALRHPNIVRVREMVVGSSIDKVFMVMDFGGHDMKASMEQLKQPFSTAEVKQLMKQFLSAIDYMHKNWYLHRDLKTSNILYKNGLLSVCDFGLARKYGSPIAPYTHEVVTLWYRCPEVLLGSKTYSTPLDMWSVGCIFAEMLTGKTLLQGEGELDQINKIFKLLGAPTEESWPGFSALPNAAKINWKVGSRSKLRELFPTTSFSGGVYLNDTGFDLLNRLLSLDPSKRLSAGDGLQHPWLTTEAPFATPLDMMPRVISKDSSD